VTDIALRRLHAQRLTGEPFTTAVDAVRWLGAVQSQDFAGAKWALGQRTRETTETELGRLFDAGAILRTHVMRPTWHFVLPEDIRWLLELKQARESAVALPPATGSSRSPRTRSLMPRQPSVRRSQGAAT
jgi:hypothetical protein